MAYNVKTETAGNMWKVFVKVGDAVKEGDVLFIMEVMKMEVNHAATGDGVVKAVHIKEDDVGIEADFVAIEIE